MPLSLVKYISKLLEIRFVYLALRHALPQEVFFRFFYFSLLKPLAPGSLAPVRLKFA